MDHLNNNGVFLTILRILLMLMLMADNNNTNNVQTNSNESLQPQQPTSFSQPPVIANPSPPVPVVTSPLPPKPVVKKSRVKLIISVLVIVLLFGASTTAAFYIGKHKRIVVIAAVPKKPIDLPPDAIVISQCTPGRGKQYIIPKDIPEGPIYDVNHSEVIAIEYVLGIKQLFTNSDTFSNTILSLTNAYPVDHFSVLPVPPKPTDTDQYIQLIVYVVSKSEANSITCS
jgi:hypothetical protein